MTLSVGDAAPAFELETLAGGTLRLEDLRGDWVHLQFHRYAGCPSCLLHVRRFAARHDEIRDAGLRHVALFHSPREDLEVTCDDAVPFPLVSDPDKAVFKAYGVQRSVRGLFTWRTLRDSVLGILKGHWWRPSMARAGWKGHPADVLVGPDGAVEAVHYGADYADSWSVDAVLEVLDERRR